MKFGMKRCLAALLVVLLATPSAVFAQASKAGVVTTLEGNVTARRVALPDAVPLQFKSDVFLRDQVATGDKSLARMLLGGKAVVTVRERSLLTITDTADKSTIDLESGKFSLVVAREKMRPGEEILIRTPNAVAGVRGTVVVTEVTRQGGQPTGAPVTKFYVLRGTIVVQWLDPATKQPIGAPQNVGTLETSTATGAAPPSFATVFPAQVGPIIAGLTPVGHNRVVVALGEAEAKAQVKAQHVQTAVALLTELTSDTSDTQFVPVHAPTPTPTSGDFKPKGAQEPVVTVQNPEVIDTFSASGASLEECIVAAGIESFLIETFFSFDGDFTSTSLSALFQFTNQSFFTKSSFITVTKNGKVILAGPLASFVNSSVFAGGSLLEILGSLKSTGSSALLGLDPTQITAAKSLILLNGGSLTLAGPLLNDTNGTIMTAGSFLDLSNGATLTDTSTNALVQLTGTALAGVSALTMSNATMNLAGPLATLTSVKDPDPAILAAALSLVGINVASLVDGPFIAIENSSSLTSTGTSPLIQITSTKIDNNETIIRVASGSKVNLAGSLLKTTDSQLIAGNVNRSFIEVADGSSITTTGTSDPLLQFIGTSSGASSVTAARNFFDLSFRTTTNSPSMTLSGPWLSATLTDFKVGDPTSNTFSFLSIFDGSQVRSTSNQPFLSFANSSVDASGNILSIRRSVSGTPTRLTLAGPLFSATNSTFNTTSLGFGNAFSTSPGACCPAFNVQQGALLSSTTPSALIQLTSSTVTGNDAQSGGAFLRIADTFTGAPGSELVSPASVSLAGPLLSATNSTITSLFDLVQVQRSSLSSTTTSPLISLSGGSVTLGGTNAIDSSTAFGSVLRVLSSSTSGTPASAASISLAGPLLSMSGGSLTKNGNILDVTNGATFTSTTTSPLISISNGATVTGSTPNGFSGAFLSISGFGGPSGTAPATATFSGPLLSVTGGTLNMPRDLFLGAIAGGTVIANDPTQAFVSLSGGTHTVGSVPFTQLFRITGLNTALDTDPLITGIGGIITVGTDQPLQRSGSGAFLSLSNGATLDTNQGLFLDRALLGASAPLFDLSGSSTLTTASDAINLNQNAKLTSVGPLVKINGSTMNINRSAVRVAGGSGLSISGNGDLLSISNGGKLNITNGGALFVSGGSVVNVTGALVNFSGTGGNQLNITNTLCTSCSGFGDFFIPVELRNGATAGNVTITVSTNTIKGSGLGAINLSNPTIAPGGTAVIILDGATSRVRIGGLP